MKKHYKLTPVERTKHEQAVRLRKMTDEQLIQHITELKDAAYERGLKTNSKIEKTADACSTQQAVNDFISAIKPGSGIGQATIFKLQKFAEANGFTPKREGQTNE